MAKRRRVGLMAVGALYRRPEAPAISASFESHRLSASSRDTCTSGFSGYTLLILESQNRGVFGPQSQRDGVTALERGADQSRTSWAGGRSARRGSGGQGCAAARAPQSTCRWWEWACPACGADGRLPRSDASSGRPGRPLRRRPSRGIDAAPARSPPVAGRRQTPRAARRRRRTAGGSLRLPREAGRSRRSPAERDVPVRVERNPHFQSSSSIRS